MINWFVFLKDNYQVKAIMLGPERWWSICVHGKARRNSGGGLEWYWRANRSSDIQIGAKD